MTSHVIRPLLAAATIATLQPVARTVWTLDRVIPDFHSQQVSESDLPFNFDPRLNIKHPRNIHARKNFLKITTHIPHHSVIP